MPNYYPNVTKSVMILESDALLGAGLSSLLNEREGFNVVSMPLDNQARFAQNIVEIRPDVIIVDENLLMDHINEILLAAWQVPDLRLISLTLNHNHMHVIERHLVEVRQSADLLALI